MFKMMLFVSFASALLLLGGCATRPLTPAEQAFRSAQMSCTEQTDAMVGGSRFRWGDSFQWGNYFEWCMNGMGYTKEQLQTLWY